MLSTSMTIQPEDRRKGLGWRLHIVIDAQPVDLLGHKGDVRIGNYTDAEIARDGARADGLAGDGRAGVIWVRGMQFA